MPDAIPRLNAALEGRYRIERQIGEGGMATVYLARDVRHERNVALKVLRPELAAVVGAERFLSEIKTTANLQHPHILPLFDSGEADNFLFYVMPYIEGESLRERLDRERQLPVDEAVQIATNVAEALDYAHAHGVIHRDIKPANILLQSGKPLISDFGIALAVGAAGGGRLTETGLSLGTPHYMSPEQAVGDVSVGATTDIYALGCVLYEMLVGDPPFIGSSAQAILGKIVTGDADPVTKHRRAVPAHVDATIRKALEKVPADRFASAGALAAKLHEPAFRHGATAVATGGGAGRRQRWVVAAALAGLGVGALGGSWLARPPAVEPLVVQFDVPLPDGYSSTMWYPTLALSPDGRSLAFAADIGSDRFLYVQSLADPQPRRVESTSRPEAPFFSPDGQTLGFWDDGRLRTVPVGGGIPTTILEVPLISGASWSPRDEIVFSQAGTLWRVPASGAARATPIPSSLGDERGFFWPDVLPGGATALVTLAVRDSRGADSLAVVDLETGSITSLELTSGNARYSDSGHVLYGTPEGTLFAAPFDWRKARITGGASPVAQGVDVTPANVTQFTVSRSGSLAFVSGSSPETQMAVVSGDGSPVSALGEVGAYGSPRISPDGTRVAVQVITRDTMDIWIHDQGTGSLRRLTVGGNGSPAWAPDGTRVAYASMSGDVYWRAADGTGEPDLIWQAGNPVFELDVTPDGSGLVFRMGRPAMVNGIDIWYLGLDGGGPEPLVNTGANELQPAVSPDGRWLAYVSDESGDREVYVRSLGGAGGVARISLDGGDLPSWGWDPLDLTLYYDTANEIVVAHLSAANGISVGSRESLFSRDGGRIDEVRPYPDGDRFLTLGRSPLADEPRLTRIVNGLARLPE